MLTRLLRLLFWLGLAVALLGAAALYVRERHEAASAPVDARSAGPDAPPAPPPAGPAVLVLYDVPLGKADQKLGQSYAMMLANLLGHFDARVQLQPVRAYRAGRMQEVDATFYVGTRADAELPPAFRHDALRTRRPLVWMRDNLGQLGEAGLSLAQARGFSFLKLRGFDARPSRDDPSPGFFDTVRYKGLPFTKYYRFDAARQAADADPELGMVRIDDPARARAVVPIEDSRSGEVLPYVVRAGTFWYVADLPFSFIGPRDRYLVFADLLHDMLGIDHAEDHRAMIRLEDIHAMVNPASIERVADYLYRHGIPFSLAVIPRYRDPLGIYNHGEPQDIPLARANSLRRALDYAVERGGEIVAHGYTHQHAASPNPVSGVSAEDYEFWDAVHNRPLPQETTAWALERLRAAAGELRANGYDPVAWTTPHYQASPIASRAVPRVFATTYQRGTYYTSDKPQLAAAGVHDYVAWQFYPYVITRDVYGQRVLPENLGNVQYMVNGRLTGRTLGYSYADLLTNARYALAVRDGFASFFFHPFLLDVHDVDGWQQLVRTVEGITELGYAWTSPARLRSAPVALPPASPANPRAKEPG